MTGYCPIADRILFHWVKSNVSRYCDEEIGRSVSPSQAPLMAGMQAVSRRFISDERVQRASWTEPDDFLFRLIVEEAAAEPEMIELIR